MCARVVAWVGGKSSLPFVHKCSLNAVSQEKRLWCQQNGYAAQMVGHDLPKSKFTRVPESKSCSPKVPIIDPTTLSCTFCQTNATSTGMQVYLSDTVNIQMWIFKGSWPLKILWIKYFFVFNVNSVPVNPKKKEKVKLNFFVYALFFVKCHCTLDMIMFYLVRFYWFCFFCAKISLVLLRQLLIVLQKMQFGASFCVSSFCKFAFCWVKHKSTSTIENTSLNNND